MGWTRWSWRSLPTQLSLAFCDNLSRRPCSFPFPPVRRQLLPTRVSPVGQSSPSRPIPEKGDPPRALRGASPAGAQRAALRAHRAPLTDLWIRPSCPSPPAPLGPARHARHFPRSGSVTSRREGRAHPGARERAGRGGARAGPAAGARPRPGSRPGSAPLTGCPPLFVSFSQPLSARRSLQAPATSDPVGAITPGKQISMAASLPCHPRSACTPTSSNRKSAYSNEASFNFFGFSARLQTRHLDPEEEEGEKKKVPKAEKERIWIRILKPQKCQKNYTKEALIRSSSQNDVTVSKAEIFDIK